MHMGLNPYTILLRSLTVCVIPLSITLRGNNQVKFKQLAYAEKVEKKWRDHHVNKLGKFCEIDLPDRWVMFGSPLCIPY